MFSPPVPSARRTHTDWACGGVICQGRGCHTAKKMIPARPVAWLCLPLLLLLRRRHNHKVNFSPI